MNVNDLDFLKTLTDPKTPFLDIVRAVHRANLLMCETARTIVRAELENLQEAFGIDTALNPEDVHLDVYPRADDSSWEYRAYTAGARIWLPDPVEAKFWLFVEFSDEPGRLVTALEFPRPSARSRWLDSRQDRPEFTEASWDDDSVLEWAVPLGDITQVEEALANLLREFLAEVRRVR